MVSSYLVSSGTDAVNGDRDWALLTIGAFIPMGQCKLFALPRLKLKPPVANTSVRRLSKTGSSPTPPTTPQCKVYSSASSVPSSSSSSSSSSSYSPSSRPNITARISRYTRRRLRRAAGGKTCSTPKG